MSRYALLTKFNEGKPVELEQAADPEYREHWISEAAYYMAEQRNFAQGLADRDWLISEQAFLSL